MSVFVWFLLPVLVSRVLMIVSDAPLTRRQALALALAQSAALLVASPTLALLPLALVILFANLVGAWLERLDPRHILVYRLGVLLAILVAAGLSFAPALRPEPNPLLLAAADWLRQHFLYTAWIQAQGGEAVPLVLIGALLVMNETNLLIRLILQVIRVVPRREDADPEGATQPRDAGPLILPPTIAGAPPLRLDQREYNAGRFIGVLERLLVYGIVLQGQYAAIGLILAAKSFARFKEMDERDFAEYVLIGTLLSVTSALAVGETIKALLP